MHAHEKPQILIYSENCGSSPYLPPSQLIFLRTGDLWHPLQFQNDNANSIGSTIFQQNGTQLYPPNVLRECQQELGTGMDSNRGAGTLPQVWEILRLSKQDLCVCAHHWEMLSNATSFSSVIFFLTLGKHTVTNFWMLANLTRKKPTSQGGLCSSLLLRLLILPFFKPCLNFLSKEPSVLLPCHFSAALLASSPTRFEHLVLLGLCSRSNLPGSRRVANVFQVGHLIAVWRVNILHFHAVGVTISFHIF